MRHEPCERERERERASGASRRDCRGRLTRIAGPLAITVALGAASGAIAEDFRIIDLGEIEEKVPQPRGINLFGQIVGLYVVGGADRAFIWSPKPCGPFEPSSGQPVILSLHDLLPGSAVDSAALDVGDGGYAVGRALVGVSGQDAIVWDFTGEPPTWAALPNLGGDNEARGVNDEDPPVIVGASMTGLQCGGVGIDPAIHAWRFRYGSENFEQLSTDQSVANAVRNNPANDNDRAVGWRNVDCEGCETPLGGLYPCIDGRFWSTSESDLEPLETDAYAEGRAIADTNEIVGTSREGAPATFRAAYWSSPSASSTELPGIAASHDVFAEDIASPLAFDAGAKWVVGTDEFALSGIRWSHDGSGWTRHYLEDELDSALWTEVRSAEAINANGWITGIGVMDGASRAYVMVPRDYCLGGDIAGPNGECIPDGVVNFTDLLAVLTQWGWTGPSSDLAADADASGEVGFGDLVAVLGSWGPCYPEQASACGTSLSLEEELAAVGITMESWGDYLDVLGNGTTKEKQIWSCWFNRRVSGCTQCPPCPGADPFPPTVNP